MSDELNLTGLERRVLERLHALGPDQTIARAHYAVERLRVGDWLQITESFHIERRYARLMATEVAHGVDPYDSVRGWFNHIGADPVEAD